MGEGQRETGGGGGGGGGCVYRLKLSCLDENWCFISRIIIIIYYYSVSPEGFTRARQIHQITGKSLICCSCHVTSCWKIV